MQTECWFQMICQLGHRLPRAKNEARALQAFLHEKVAELRLGDRSLLSSLHTFKGNTLTLRMIPLERLIHELETALQK